MTFAIGYMDACIKYDFELGPYNVIYVCYCWLAGFPYLFCPPLHFGAAFSSPAFSVAPDGPCVERLHNSLHTTIMIIIHLPTVNSNSK